MNFVFIIDTSLSMNQTFDSISYFDYAKSSIRKFVLDREINNYKLNRNKSDKYFLVTLNQNTKDNFTDNWSTTTEHFLYQLNALKISYDFTNIDYAIKKGFQMINSIKKLGNEKHIYGRLFSKIQNSYIILITDGGNFSSQEKVLDNYLSLSLKEESEFILEKYPNIYKELYRWDHSFYAIVLTDKKDFESFKALSKISKNVGGTIITVDNPNSLNDILYELSNKSFQNNRIYINFNINKTEKKNFITYLEYNGYIDKMNEKWPFPDELILNKDISVLPSKNSLPFYEFGNIQYKFPLTHEFCDEYDIKDKDFILFLLSDGDCLRTLKLKELIKQFKSCLVIDILVSNLNDKKILKKPFGVLCLFFDKKLLDIMNEFIVHKEEMTINEFFKYKCYININNIKANISNNIKCKFYNLPYFYSEFKSLIDKYKSQAVYEFKEMQLNLDKYFSIIPFYYMKYIINCLEKNKIIKLYNKESIKQKMNENISNGVLLEIEKLSQIENKQVAGINKSYTDNKKLHSEKKALCCKKENVYNNINNYNIMNTNNEVEEDNEYLNFIENVFNVDKINNNINNINNNNNNNIELNIGYRNVYQFNKNYNDNNHESDIDIMGDYRDYFFRKEHLRTYLIPEIEIRYLIKDFFFGNQFIERKKAYSSNQITNNSIINNEKLQDESIFHYLNDEDNNINYNHSNININNNNKAFNNINNNYNNIPNNDNKNSNIKIDFNCESLDNQMKKIISEQNKDKEKKDNKHLINNKRNRENSMDDINLDNPNLNNSFTADISIDSSSPPSSNYFNDNFSDTDGINNLMLDEFSDNKYNSKMTSSLIDEFKNNINLDNNVKKDGIKISVKYNISNEKLNKWKFQKKIKTLSQELINSIHNDENNIIKVVTKIIDKNIYAPDKKMIYNFVEKMFLLCQSYGVNPMIQTQIQELMKSYS